MAARLVVINSVTEVVVKF